MRFRARSSTAGSPQFEEKGDVTTIGGTTAAFRASAEGLERVASELEAYPTMDIVHVQRPAACFWHSFPEPR